MLSVTQCRETGSNTVRPQEAEQQQASGQGSGGAAIGHDPADRVRSHSAPAAPRDPGGPAASRADRQAGPGGDRRCTRSRAEEPAHGRGATHARVQDCGAGPGSGRMSAHRRTSKAMWPLAGRHMRSPAPRRAPQARQEAPWCHPGVPVQPRASPQQSQRTSVPGDSSGGPANSCSGQISAQALSQTSQLQNPWISEPFRIIKPAKLLARRPVHLPTPLRSFSALQIFYLSTFGIVNHHVCKIKPISRVVKILGIWAPPARCTGENMNLKELSTQKIVRATN